MTAAKKEKTVVEEVEKATEPIYPDDYGVKLSQVVEQAARATFKKSDILRAVKYRENRDVLQAVLDAEREYTADDLQRVIDNFKKEGVK